MAIQNTQGNYLRIDKVDPNSKIVHCSLFKDQSTREAPSEFDKAVEMGYDVSSKFDQEATSYTSTGNLLGDLKTVGYLALKNEPPFNGASGETWTDC